MSRSKQSTKGWAGAFLGLSAVALVGSAHAAVLYSSEDFEGGTPNYTVTGVAAPYTLTQLQDGGVNIAPATALAGTDYTPGSTSRMGIFANNGIPGAIIGEPSGQHAFVSQSQNRSLTLTVPMTLVTDGVQTLNITFDTLLYRFDDGVTTDFDDAAAVFYSALGDFSDAVQIATYATVNMTEPVTFPDEPASILGHTTVVEDTWSTLNLSLSSTDVTFSDTAKIRFNKLPSTGLNLMIFYDDISVEGVVPEPSTAALLGLAGFALLRRRRK